MTWCAPPGSIGLHREMRAYFLLLFLLHCGAANGALGQTRWKDLRQKSTQVGYRGHGMGFDRVASVQDPYGVSSSAGDLDWQGRPESVDTGFEKITFDHSNPYSVKATSETGVVQTESYSTLGELRAQSDSFGVGYAMSVIPGGQSSLTVEGRTTSFQADGTGFVSQRGNGGGSRGGQSALGVEGGMLNVQQTELRKDGAPGGTVVTSVYDAQGRLVRMDSPDAHGGVQSESWTYDDLNRKVTYAPRPGPSAETLETVLSGDGLQQSISKGGQPWLRVTRSAMGSALVQTTELYDDSSGAVAWKVLKTEALNPSSGTSTVTPWGLASNAQTMATAPPGATTTVTSGSGPAVTRWSRRCRGVFRPRSTARSWGRWPI